MTTAASGTTDEDPERAEPVRNEAERTGPERTELERLRAEVRDLRARSRARPLISQAQGMLQERYALPDADGAFTLMRQVSQRFNIKMRTLAGVLVTTPRPDGRTVLWFPRRVRRPEPALGFLPDHPAGGRGHGHSRGAVLGAVLGRTLAVVDTDMGNVQTVDRVRGGLRIERHTGLTDDFVDFFERVGETGTSCAKAARDLAQVTVRDVASDPVFSEPARAAVLAAGSRACHSVPLTSAAGLCVGMVSAHVEHPLRELRPSELKTLDALGAQAGRWLAWHERTVLLDALEYLHALGRARGTRPAGA
ncbi:ANTAR domain-containing protein [Streptomyces sp. NBC_01485]|uniref:ANTAR domain-containing protein n=1 Tax=Streptomyces sp. NBC_01485 TaxID=2903884 RepID=UPI002E377140|nr:ANTAR domain-containing protein [Streptomyces sp. NBC_01485]